MKNIHIFLIFLVACTSYGQNSVTIVNSSTLNFQFQLGTRPISTSATHPILDSGLVLYTLTPAMALFDNPPAGGATGIGYESASTPYINTWRRQTTVGGTYANTPNATAMALFTNTQRWDYVKWTFPALSWGVPHIKRFHNL